jgi:hypothetical protein
MKNYFITVLLAYFFFTCDAQTNLSSVDFFSLIQNPENIWTTELSIEQEKSITVIYYEIYMKDARIGQGCIYAIQKGFSDQWAKEAISQPQGECAGKKNYKHLYYVNCAAKSYFTKNQSELTGKFDIYVFFVNKEDLEGPLEESSESGTVEYYNEKPESKIIIYKYASGSWIEIEKRKLGDEVPRTFGLKYLKELARKEFRR